jgi:uncharacterized membrane protein
MNEPRNPYAPPPIPLLLGLLISIPIMVLTNYTVYRDIFVEEGT